MLDRKVKDIKKCCHEILLSFINKCQNFHYTECGRTKLLQESSIAELCMNIKLRELVVNTPGIGIKTHTKKSLF